LTQFTKKLKLNFRGIKKDNLRMKTFDNKITLFVDFILKQAQPLQLIHIQTINKPNKIFLQ